MEAFNECLQALKNGDRAKVSIETLEETLKNGDAKLMDHVQYALHELCSSEKASEVPVAFVQQIIDICYTPANLDSIKVVDRLIGCVASFMAFFVKKVG